MMHLTEETRTAVRDAVAQALAGTYYCDRVWSAWQCGTMSQDDFSPADENDDILNGIVDAVLQQLAPAAQLAEAPTPEDIEQCVALIESVYVSQYTTRGTQYIMRQVLDLLRASPAAAPEAPTAPVVATITGSDTVIGRESRGLQWAKGISAFDYEPGTRLYAAQNRDAAPLDERDMRVLRFALQMFQSSSYLHLNAAAQDKRDWYKAGAVPAFERDAKDADRLLANLSRLVPIVREGAPK